MTRARRLLVDCPSRKLAFGTRAKATKWMKQERRRHRQALVPYICRHCDLWHLTSSRSR